LAILAPWPLNPTFYVVIGEITLAKQAKSCLNALHPRIHNVKIRGWIFLTATQLYGIEYAECKSSRK
jgi:hypothetical protein